jgi:hypothetical protein
MIQNYMSWQGGVDLLGTYNGAMDPNLIIHVAEMVHTPVGSAPAGMILLHPDPKSAPEMMGFISPVPAVGAYFGPRIFTGTPFEEAPVLKADLSIKEIDHVLTATLEVEGRTIVCSLSDFGDLEMVNRGPAGMAPFSQQVLEAPARSATVTVDGDALDVTIARQGLSGGPGAVSSPAGIYSR